MSYSDTTGQTKINVDQLIAYAFREAGKTAEEMTPEYVEAGKQALLYNLQNLSNLGVNLWLLENQLYGTVGYQQKLDLPATTIDIREANWVYTVIPGITAALPVSNTTAPNAFAQNLDLIATASAPNNWIGAGYTGGQRVFYVGWNSYGTSTYNFAFETSDDGITWTTRETFPEVTLNDRQWKYYPITTTPLYNYYRLRETVAAGFSVRQIVFSTSQQVIPLARLNRDDYWNLPNKQFPSVRSLQYWYDRQIEPSMYLWPIPNNDFQLFQLIVEKQPQDVGSLTDQLYIPNRWVACIQKQLSHQLALQIPGTELTRIQYLEQQANLWYEMASAEERDKSPIYYQPNISYYTR